MGLVVVVVRGVSDRAKGFLASVMLEVGVGVYVSPKMSQRVRAQVQEILIDWHRIQPMGGMVWIWQDKKAPSGLAILQVGEPYRALHDAEGIWITRSIHMEKK